MNSIVPSTYARWRELRRLNKLLRKYKRIHQGAPNAVNPLQITQYLHQAIPFLSGGKLKTMLIAMFDLRGNATVRPLTTIAACITNWLGGNFRWQLLPTPFAVYADGIDVVFFEEFGAGEMALDLRDQVQRNALLKDESYRRRVRKFYGEKLSPRVWQRDFADAIIADCPDKTLVGRNFDEVAKQRGIHVVDLFLDMVGQWGRSLRWYTTVANHREDTLRKMVRNPDTLITFSDTGVVGDN